VSPPEVQRRRPRQETPSITIADSSLLVAWIEKQLGHSPRCHDCGRPLHALRSILAGIGPRCAAKRAVRRP
jgi:ribosomal protein L34E